MRVRGFDMLARRKDRGLRTDIAALRVRVEFNPSRFLRHGLCPVGHVLPVADAVVQQLQYLFPVAQTRTGCEVERIDLARDFAVARPQEWLEACRGVRPAYAREQHGYFGKDGALETMVTGSKACRVQLYDKSRQAPSAWTERHNLRWEAQLKDAEQASRYGLGRLEHLTQERLLQGMERLWAYSRMGDVLVHPTYARLIDASGHERALKRDLIAHPVASAEGFSLGFADEERQKLEKPAQVLGIRVKKGVVGTAVAARRLDFSTGREVPCTPT